LEEQKSRNSIRESCYAKAIYQQETGYIRNVSAEGFRVDLIDPREISIGEIISLTIISEESLQIKEFELKAEVRWQQEKSPYVEIGLLITEISIAAQAEFNKLLEVYKKS
jgi:hypothetical protein